MGQALDPVEIAIVFCRSQGLGWGKLALGVGSDC